jgi:DNA-binding NtrC family response regulator
MAEPVVWIVDADHWPRACLRAELIERGYDAIGIESIADALERLLTPGEPRPQVVVIDVAGQTLDRHQLARFNRAGARAIGIARAARRPRLSRRAALDRPAPPSRQPG